MGVGPRRTVRSHWKRILQVAAALVVIAIGSYAIGAAVAGPFFWYSCSLNGLEAHGQTQASVLFYSDGSRLGSLGASSNRLPVSFRKISPVMRTAIVDTEDQRFYSNNGIDYIGILRALKADIFAGSAVQGASTIEQQLVRNLYLSPQESLSRKITEACLAVQLDRHWSKDRILTAYLNDIYFGNQAYGIEAAARAYFSVPASKLTLDQAALLAGLPQAPTAYDPLLRPAAARARRAEVLKAMLSAGDISQAQYKRALRSPLGLHPAKTQPSSAGTYLADFITSQLVNEYGAQRVRQGGLRVYTTLDPKMQTGATQAVLGTLNRKGDPAGSIISIDPSSGQIRAMAVAQTGGKIAYDIPADAQRQAGSTFKMFVLTEAVLRQINPWATKYLSAPFLGPKNWHVTTYDHTYAGRIPIYNATLLSDNTVYARLTLDLGPKSIADVAQKMGISSTLKPVPSLGLGVNAVSPLDLATAYATLAAGGIARQPTILSKVTFPDGHTETASRPNGTRVVDAKVAGVVTKVLEGNVRSGTGTAAALPGRPVAGKTGTTDRYTDAWFAGWVPQLTTVVWMGHPKSERPMGTVHGISQVTGGTFPAQIWHTYMAQVLRGQPVEQFADPGAPQYTRWCGRYQFALTWRNARKHATCQKHHKKHKKKHKKHHKKKHHKTTSTQTTTVATTTLVHTTPPPTTTRRTTTRQTTTIPPPPPTTTTTTTPTTTP